MTKGALEQRALENQTINEDSLNDFFSYVSTCPARSNFNQLIETMPDRKMALALEGHAIDMVLFAIERMSHLGRIMSHAETEA